MRRGLLLNSSRSPEAASPGPGSPRQFRVTQRTRLPSHAHVFTLQPRTERLLCAEHGRCSGYNGGPHRTARLQGSLSKLGTVSHQRSIHTSKDAAVGRAGRPASRLLVGVNAQSLAPEMPPEGRAAPAETGHPEELTPTCRPAAVAAPEEGRFLSPSPPACRGSRGWAGSSRARGKEARSRRGGQRRACTRGNGCPVSPRPRPRRKGERVLTGASLSAGWIRGSTFHG